MYPLIKFGFFEISTNYLFIYLALIVAITLFLYRSKRAGVPMIRATDISIFLLITIVTGSRLFHIAFSDRLDYFLSNPLEIFKIWKGGFSSSGGGILFFAVTFAYCRYYKVNVWQIFDLFMPSCFFALALARLGCLSAGCCYGEHTDAWYGLVFGHLTDTKPLTGVPLGVSLWPAQPVLAFNALCWGLFSLFYYKRKRFDGEVFALSLVGYSIGRFLIEFKRYQDTRYEIFGVLFTDFQIVAMLLVPAMIIITVLGRRQGWGKTAAPT